MEIESGERFLRKDPVSEELEGLLKEAGVEAAFFPRILQFYQIVLAENEVQNLTRLTSPSDFFLGHLWDVLELNRLGWVGFPAMDLGTGGGVPGIPMAILGGGQWVLADSEKKKAEYLQRAVDNLGLSEQVRVFAGRAEDFLKNNSVDSIVVRAVGPVDRIYSWIRPCSTWNKLVLLKGPSWEEEWNRFLTTKWKKELKIEKEHEYLVGPEQKKRKVILLTRVPRGTIP